MKNFLLLTTWALASIAFAALPPQTSTSLRNHLEEVNSEWKNYPELLRAEVDYQFASDVHRIQEHLHQVVLLLKSNTHTGCTNYHQREILISQLSEYAAVGIFPKNTISPKRTPVFIDEKGVHCAVGYLMAINGFAEIAGRVSACNNAVYLREIPEKDLDEWMRFSGLSISEMALIQPGYSPPYSWDNEGQNFSGEVNDVISFNGSIYITGDLYFGSEQSSLAKKLDDNFELVAGAIGVGRDLEIYDGRLYVAGHFSGQNLIVLDQAEELSFQTIGISKLPLSYCLLAANDKLYASSDASGFVPMSAILEYDGENWNTIGLGATPTYSLLWHNGQLIAAGEPGNLYNNEFEELSVAAWNGTEWSQLGDGFNDRIEGLISIGDSLFACGPVSHLGEIHYGYAWYTDEVWTTVDPGAWENYFNSPVNEQESYSYKGFYKIGNSYYIYGQMRGYGGIVMIIGSGIYNFNPQGEGEIAFPWKIGAPVLPQFPLDQSVNCMLYDGSRTWAGGNFQVDNQFTFNQIVSSPSFVVSIGEQHAAEKPLVFPNPGRGFVTIRFPAFTKDLGGQPSYELYNGCGQIVEQGRLIFTSGESAEIRLNDHQSGLYQLRLCGTKAVHVLPILFE